jgi:hypothetical protein
MRPRSDRMRIVAGAVLLAAALAGCSDLYYDRRETVSFAADEAVAASQATQIIDPWPPASANRNVVSSGPVVAGALERYRTCQIIPPRATTTSGTSGYAAAQPTPQLGCAPSAAAAPGSTKP